MSAVMLSLHRQVAQQRQNLTVVKQSLALQPIGHGGCTRCIFVDRDPRQTRAGLVGTLGTQSELARLYRADELGKSLLEQSL